MYFYGWHQQDYIAIVMFMGLIIIALSEKASISKMFPKCFTKITDFTLALYLGQEIGGMVITPPVAEKLAVISKWAPLTGIIAVEFLYAFVWTLLVRRLDKAGL